MFMFSYRQDPGLLVALCQQLTQHGLSCSARPSPSWSRPHTFPHQTCTAKTLHTNSRLPQCAHPTGMYSSPLTNSLCRIHCIFPTTTFLRVFTAFRRVFCLECLAHGFIFPTSLSFSPFISSSRSRIHYCLRVSDTDQRNRRIRFHLTF